MKQVAQTNSILEMAHGAFLERVDYEMARVIDNILDLNTTATAKRKITVTITLTPDDERRSISVDVAAKAALASTNPVRTNLYVTADSQGEMLIAELVPQSPGQLSMAISQLILRRSWLRSLPTVLL